MTRHLPLLLVSIVFVACSDPTPNGTEFFAETVEELSGETSTSKAVITLGEERPSKIELAISTVAVDGVTHITNIAGTVVDHGGWQISYLGKGDAANMGTQEKPLQALPVMVQQYRTSIKGKHFAQHSIRVYADGTAKVDQ